MKANVDIDYWRNLAERYFEAETTDTEETALRRFLAPAAATARATPTPAASELSRLEEELRQRERETGRITAALCLGGGAMLCILLL